MTGEQVLNVLKRIVELLIKIPGTINDFMSKTFNLAIDLTLFKIGDFEHIITVFQQLFMDIKPKKMDAIKKTRPW